MKAGSSAQILYGLGGARAPAPRATGRPLHGDSLPGVRRRGGPQSIGEREPGVASVLRAQARPPPNRVVAAVSVSGPIERLTRHRGRMHAQAIIDAAGRPPRPCAARADRTHFGT